jgi:hypothetical protein
MTSRMSWLGPFWEHRMRNAQSSVQAVNSKQFGKIRLPHIRLYTCLWGYIKENA